MNKHYLLLMALSLICACGNNNKNKENGNQQEHNQDNKPPLPPAPQAQDTCTAGSAKCAEKQIQYCEGSSWGLPKNCPVNKECRENSCVQVVTTREKHPLTCGNTVCTPGQLCQNGTTCLDRTAKASAEGAPCDPATFLESCDGNTLVYCKTDPAGEEEPLITAFPCGEAHCALRFNKNFGTCFAKEDINCNEKTAGEFTYCYQEDISTFFVEITACTVGADGYYYAFRDDMETVDCVGSCLDTYSCNRADEIRTCASEGYHCEENISIACAPGNTPGILEYSATNCLDYSKYCPGIKCLPESGECDWDKCTDTM